MGEQPDGMLKAGQMTEKKLTTGRAIRQITEKMLSFEAG